MKSFKLDSLAKDILLYLNNNSKVLLSSVSLNSPRAVGDAVQTEIAERAMPEVLQEFGVSSSISAKRLDVGVVSKS